MLTNLIQQNSHMNNWSEASNIFLYSVMLLVPQNAAALSTLISGLSNPPLKLICDLT